MVRAWPLGLVTVTGRARLTSGVVEPEDDVVLMFGLERDRIVFHRGLDAPESSGWGASIQ